MAGETDCREGGGGHTMKSRPSKIFWKRLTFDANGGFYGTYDSGHDHDASGGNHHG